ncbi:TolC family protein [Chryseobacterium sp. Ch-15]|uniref:TolC family protein n=1 Tax=Chryseobacterium muglaense TaxID=2893752 RepID=A0A9Q3UT08_9FLAO|nr:TolC family protein [Chryseobacterium muglaense]MBD3906092.1 TolC family protein [Chryseobacterium muglaense]MCC9032971.1 TolC family protein [Chryseobacterium muglaense]MCM2556551.1 TolC family protein [Chryseobacterium muglaense]
MRIYISGVFLVLALSHLSAQKSLDLKDCIDYGLVNHRSVKIKNNEVGIAVAEKKEVRAGYLPSVALNASVDNNLKVQEQIIPAGLLGDTDVRVAFTKQFSTTGSLQLDQKVYDQALIISLKTGKYNIEKANKNTVLNDEEVIYNITSSYYQILVYNQQYEFLNDNSTIYKEQIRIAQLQVDKGVLAEVELYKIKVNYNNNLSQVRLCEKNIANSTNQLKNSMGYPIDEEISIINEKITDELETSDENPFVAGNRTDYQIAEIDMKIQEMDYKKIKAGYLPVLSVYGKYGGTGFGDTVGQSFNSIADFSSIGVKLSMPIFDGFSRRSQLQQSKLKYDNASETLKLNESQFRMESENAKIKLEQARTSIDEESENIKLAKEVMSITDLQYTKGIIDMTEWLNAQTSLKESQNNYLNSIVDLYVAKIDLEKANGTIKNFYSNLK